jgi:hypothetical protein
MVKYNLKKSMMTTKREQQSTCIHICQLDSDNSKRRKYHLGGLSHWISYRTHKPQVVSLKHQKNWKVVVKEYMYGHSMYIDILP